MTGARLPIRCNVMAMRPRPTEAKLREEADAVRHHCWMLNQTHELYVAHVANGPDDPPGMRQALAGAFAIHARCLHEFFYADEGAHRRDLLAEHYIAGWRGIRPAKRLNADEVRRIDTELAHLSVDRMTMPPEGIGFDVEGIFAVLLPAVTAFCRTSIERSSAQTSGRTLMRCLRPRRSTSARTC
jgi:hypothetical protein